jgi:hypothetical protein
METPREAKPFTTKPREAKLFYAVPEEQCRVRRSLLRGS